jgi:hypothetical protein
MFACIGILAGWWFDLLNWVQLPLIHATLANFNG